MLKRITVVCSENDKDNIEELFYRECPFKGDIPKNCGKDKICFDCIDENVKFIVAEKSELIPYCKR